MTIRQNLKAQTSVAEKQYQGLNKLFKPDKEEEPVTIKKEKLTMTNKSKLVHDSKYSFNDYRNIRKYMIFLLWQNTINCLNFITN